MAKLNRKQIQDRVREILEVESSGVRWGEILKRIHGPDPETPPNSIHGAIQVLFQSSDDIVKVARVTYQLAKYVDADAADAVAADEAIATVPIGNVAAGAAGTLTEQDFYASFAEWLVENDEATVAEALGGSSLGGKWGTPDVSTHSRSLEGRTAPLNFGHPFMSEIAARNCGKFAPGR